MFQQPSKYTRINQSPHWVTFSTVSHNTDLVSQRDGYTILLHPRLTGDARSVNAQGEETAYVTEQHDDGSGEARGKEAQGLQRFSNFVFVDSAG